MTTTPPEPLPEVTTEGSIRLIRAVADKIETEPELYNQVEWSSLGNCGTAHCVAGWAIALAYPESSALTTAYDRFDTSMTDLATHLLDLKLSYTLDLFSAVPTEMFPTWNDASREEQAQMMTDKLREIADMKESESNE